MGGNATANNNTQVIIINNNDSPDAPTKNFIATLITWLNSLVGGSGFPVYTQKAPRFMTRDGLLS